MLKYIPGDSPTQGSGGPPDRPLTIHDYVCSHCGAAAGYDGRCGDGPYLMCKCDQLYGWINDGRGGYYDGPGRPVHRSDRR